MLFYGLLLVNPRWNAAGPFVSYAAASDQLILLLILYNLCLVGDATPVKWSLILCFGCYSMPLLASLIEGKFSKGSNTGSVLD